MGNFQMKIDIEPRDIPSLDDAHKQDCAAALNRSINSAFKYTMIYVVSVFAVFGVYTLFSLVFMLRMHQLLPHISPAIPALAGLIAVFEFAAGMMKRWAIVIEILLHIALAVFSLTGLQSALAMPFAVYGIFIHIKLLTLVPYYDVISKLKGFPDFTPLPIGDVVKKVDAVDTQEEKIPAEQENISPAKQEEPKKQPVPEEIPEAPAEKTEKEEKAEKEKTETAEEKAEETLSREEKAQPAKEETRPSEEKKNSPQKTGSSRRKKKKHKK